MDQQNLTEKEIQQATELLSKLPPGYLPMPIFNQLCRLMTISTAQIIPFRRVHGGTIQVLLIPRELDNAFHPGKWHNPGTVIRPTDTLENAITRLLEGEMNNTLIDGGLNFAEMRLHTCDRGQELLQIYWAEITGEPKTGKFFDVDNLADNTIPSEVEIVRVAEKYYRKSLGEKI